MLDQPAWKVVVAFNFESTEDALQTPPAIAQRVAVLLARFRILYPQLPAVKISTQSTIDFHSGLGSGTQLTLALGTALLLLCNEPRPASIADLAVKLGRNRRSAIGTWGFDHGGFILDHGRFEDTIRRFPFPEGWRMVLLTPTTSEGLSGDSEEAFFGQREFLDPRTLENVDRLIHNEVLPSIEQADFPTFRNSLAEYGNMVGQYYSEAQGGIIGSEMVRQVTGRLAQQGITGAVQSSWGPTVCIPAASDCEAQAIRQAIFSTVTPETIYVTIASGMNSGATVRSPSPENYRSLG